jgi:hypothetical protein
MIEGPNMQANLYAELTIEWMLTKTFLSDSFFWSNPAKASFDLKRVLEFFDINCMCAERMLTCCIKSSLWAFAHK